MLNAEVTSVENLVRKLSVYYFQGRTYFEKDVVICKSILEQILCTDDESVQKRVMQ